ncbi:MAG: LLM class flavin-dependent oxidoreductase [Chloroflexi bacterium]|nr:LLM class flavin-dependent oxidoreductase [Chloroflexota bacterium]
MKHPFRFGGGLFRAESHAAWADGARWLEAAGYDTALIGDHFSSTFFAPIPALLAAALATTSLRVGAPCLPTTSGIQPRWPRSWPLPMC